MRILLRLVVGLILLLLLVIGLQVVASESGEVVVLSSRDAAGAESSTRVWVVEREGELWVRGANRDGSWAQRALASPVVRLTRGQDTLTLRAVAASNTEIRREINGQFRSKYGWRDTVISWLIGDPDRSDALILQLATPAE